MLGWDVTGDAMTAPAVARNRDAILSVLRGLLPETGTVLEIASGSGEHVVHFAAAFPGLIWQPSDPEPAARRSIAAHAGASGLPNLLVPLPLDVSHDAWPPDRVDAVLAINMIHIAPWAATKGLMRGASAVLKPDAPLILYGPFREGGLDTAPSNADFDADLKARNPAWGVRDIEAVREEAASRHLRLAGRIAMPANNIVVVFRREAVTTG